MPEAPPELFPALADPLRRRLLEILVSAPRTTADLAERCGLPRASVGHHLKVLARAGLVRQRQGRAAVRPEGLAAARRYVDLALTVAAVGSAPAILLESHVVSTTQP